HVRPHAGAQARAERAVDGDDRARVPAFAKAHKTVAAVQTRSGADHHYAVALAQAELGQLEDRVLDARLVDRRVILADAGDTVERRPLQHASHPVAPDAA